MSFRTASSRRAFGLVLGLLLIAGVASAHWYGRNESSDFHRFSILLGGGYGFSEGHQGMLDLNTELQFGLTSRIRLGLGIGCLNGEGRHGFYGEWKDGNEGMIGRPFLILYGCRPHPPQSNAGLGLCFAF